MLAAIGALVALLTDCTIEFERVDTSVARTEPEKESPAATSSPANPPAS